MKMLTILALASAVTLPAFSADAQTIRLCRLEPDRSGGDYAAPGARNCVGVTTPPTLGPGPVSPGDPRITPSSAQETTDAERLLESALSN